MFPIWLSWKSNHNLLYGLHGFYYGDHSIFYPLFLRLGIVIDLRDFRFHHNSQNYSQTISLCSRNLHHLAIFHIAL